MNKPFGVKVVSAIFFSATIGFAGFVAAIFSALMGGEKFYMPLIIVITGGIIIFMIIGIFKLVKPRIFKLSMISFVSLALATLGAYEINKAYHDSFAAVDDNEVDLYEYHPFSETTKAVSLPEPASITLEEQLPILDGATALYPIYAAFVKATYPKKEYDTLKSEVMVTKTNQAYLNLINGNADIIFAAGPSKRQLQLAEQRGVELRLTPIGREAFVFFVNSRNQVESLTLSQIQAIYAGEILNWSEVGGNSNSIRAFQRPDDSGSQTALEKLMADKPLMTPPKKDVVAGMGGIISETSNYRNYRNSLGYSFRFFSTEMVKDGEIRHLQINDVFPDKETIRSGEYPLTAEFYAITAGSDNPNVEPFIEWILSDQGQMIIEKTGYVPIK
ncbi:substrate-binding domain-containing protein [Bacillaceae bacterium IKA-2]|nr:substrate-binding domain-containing protein [Bacillaceae bacterium IKA-2]